MNPTVDPLILDLPNDTSAPRLARRAVADLVGDHARREDVLLCVSEVVTNAVLHAGTSSQLRVRADGTRLVVEVSDRNPTLPIRRQHDLEAPTGRGLLLLDALTAAWGTSPEDGGKVVWFEVELAQPAAVPRIGGNATCRVELLGLPLDVHRRANQHAEALRRELALVAHARTPGEAPMRLYQLGVELGPIYVGLNSAADERLRAAAAASTAETIDLVYLVPERAAGDLQRLSDVCDELDRYCRDRELLTVVTPPEGVAYRRWWMGEIIEQVRDGRGPRPWAEVAATLLADDTPPAAPAPDDLTEIAVDGDLDLEQAPGLRTRLLQAIDEGARRIVVDLTGCRFLDSTGISLLITTRQRLRADGGDLTITGLAHPVRAVIELAGLDEMVM